jgi:hypothetical protein
MADDYVWCPMCDEIMIDENIRYIKVWKDKNQLIKFMENKQVSTYHDNYRYVDIEACKKCVRLNFKKTNFESHYLYIEPYEVILKTTYLIGPDLEMIDVVEPTKPKSDADAE